MTSPLPGSRPNGTNRPVLAYILAASHSGSTLLAMLLGSHPDICAVGELKATSLGDVARYRCSCGELIRECAFWQDVSRRMAAEGHAFDIADARTDLSVGASRYARFLIRPLHRGPVAEFARDAALNLDPGWRRHTRRFRQINAAFVRTLCALSGTRVVVDSSKTAVRLKYLLRNAELEVRIIHLVRDGRAVALTYINPSQFADARNPSQRGGGPGRGPSAEPLTPRAAAHEWRRSNEEAAALLAGVSPHQRTTITYEELCASPQKVLRGLFSFLGVDPAATIEDWRARSAHVVGNGMRFDSTTDVQLDDRWRTALSPDACGAFDEEAGPLNRRLGYR